MTTALAIQDAITSRPSGGLVELPEGDLEVWEPIDCPHNDLVIVGNGTRLHAMTPGMAVFMCSRPGHTRSGLRIGGDLTIRTAHPDVCGVFIANGESCKVEDVRFQGLARNVHLRGGIGYVLDALTSETSHPNPAGVVLLESSTEAGYVQYVNIDNYQSRGPTFSAPIIMHRATNVIVSGPSIHDPGTDAILIDDDSQGITIADGTIVKPRNGVVIVARNGQAPLLVTLRNLDVDQSMGLGYLFAAGNHLRAQGGSLSYGWQGVLIGGQGVGNVSLEELVVFNHQQNGIIANPYASGFTIQDCRSLDNGGAGIVISPGVSTGWTIADNTLRGNAVPFANLSTGSGVYRDNDEG